MPDSTLRSSALPIILVVENGRVQKIGSHEELLANNGRYAELFQLQAAEYRQGAISLQLTCEMSPRMPYDLPFERILKVANESALGLNKKLASELMTAFPEIHDLNSIDSGAHFTHFEIDPKDELSERHFRLWAELDEMSFGFDFWKDTLWLELGAAGNPTIRFEQVRNYAAFIVQHGFAISGVSDSEKPDLNNGIEEHLKEYKDWVGFVDYVVKALNDKPSTIA